ncbi:hypothetical protein [Mycobacterium kubicae]|uniref:hypothetical protein n=1 Tax=Mycobacterium kubicae TaxID=120959 RepID=UPI000A40C010|nr:hypothetical protein [Mycobacterium kubicae]
MTAEAIVMNRSAVALAADSAVTFDSSAGIKTYDTANKLFELIKGSNIGIMIYNSAEINSTPWETVIKTYRHEHPTFSASHVQDYANHFLDYISAHTGLITPEDERITAEMMARYQIVANLVGVLFDSPERLVTDTGRIIKTRVRAAVNRILAEWNSQLQAVQDINTGNADLNSLRTTFRDPIITTAQEIFDENDIPYTRTQLQGVADNVLLSFTKYVDHPFDTGLVFAGFGTADYFPCMASAGISARFCGSALTYDDAVVRITAERRGHWETFAVDGPAKGWANGIHDQMRTAVVLHWGQWISHLLPKQLKSSLKDEGFTSDQMSKIVKSVGEIAKNQYGEFGQHMLNIEHSMFRDPMAASIELLPKDELAILAESLVNLTSLRHRMTIDQQNIVGGPIDVALISIGDGFVWLRRKHYFDNVLNPTWHLTHGASIRTRVTTSTGGSDDTS